MPLGEEFLGARDLAGFASANGWSYAPTAAPPALGEGLWEQVASGTVRDRIAGDGWEAGRITGGSRSAQRTEEHGGWTVSTSVSVSTPDRAIDLGYLAINDHDPQGGNHATAQRCVSATRPSRPRGSKQRERDTSGTGA